MTKQEEIDQLKEKVISLDIQVLGALNAIQLIVQTLQHKGILHASDIHDMCSAVTKNLAPNAQLPRPMADYSERVAPPKKGTCPTFVGVLTRQKMNPALCAHRNDRVNP